MRLFRDSSAFEALELTPFQSSQVLDERPPDRCWRVARLWLLPHPGRRAEELAGHVPRLVSPFPPLPSFHAQFLTCRTHRGILTVLWGCFVFYWIPDSPMRAGRFFSEEDRTLMVERVRANDTGVQVRLIVQSTRECAADALL